MGELKQNECIECMYCSGVLSRNKMIKPISQLSSSTTARNAWKTRDRYPRYGNFVGIGDLDWITETEMASVSHAAARNGAQCLDKLFDCVLHRRMGLLLVKQLQKSMIPKTVQVLIKEERTFHTVQQQTAEGAWLPLAEDRSLALDENFSHWLDCR